MNPKSAIAKGKILEDYVAGQIREKGIDIKAYRSHGSGNTNNEKGDIWTSMMVLGQNAGIECKNQANLAIPDWWRQTKKLQSLGREPILAFKIYGEPLEETKVVIYLDTFLELVRSSKGVSGAYQEKPENREMKWAIENAITSLKKLLKHYDE